MWLRKGELLIGGLGALALALSAAAGFWFASYRFMQTVRPEYTSWPEILEVERSLLPVAEIMLRTRDALKQREEGLKQREKEAKDRHDQQQARLERQESRLKDEEKRLKDLADPDNTDVTKLKERISALELELAKERVTGKRQLQRIAELERPHPGLSQKLESALDLIDTSIHALDARLPAGKTEK